MASKREQWENIRQLGEGGQGKVYLVRTLQRSQARADALSHIPQLIQTVSGIQDGDKKKAASQQLAEAFLCAARSDESSELAALKEFQIRQDDEAQSLTRLKAEIRALSELKHPAVLLMLDSSVEDRFIVSQYFPLGSLQRQLNRYEGNFLKALRAFRSLADGVREIHSKGAVHRDIKPHNIFVAGSGDLVLGDFGIVFFQDGDRPTYANERVGSRYWMAPWTDRTLRVDPADLTPSLDIYPLGKLLWCLIAAREPFSREEFQDTEFNLEEQFPHDPNMKLVNALLGKCLVAKRNQCYESVELLLKDLDEIIDTVDGTHRSRGKNQLSWPCRMCGLGRYQPTLSVPPHPGDPLIVQTYQKGRSVANAQLHIYSCESCGHVELFMQ